MLQIVLRPVKPSLPERPHIVGPRIHLQGKIVKIVGISRENGIDGLGGNPEGLRQLQGAGTGHQHAALKFLPQHPHQVAVIPMDMV